jgi:RimJ/RimL family protein N-acetyltransferase
VRLRLVTPGLELIDLAIGDPDGLGRALDCEIADGWFVFPGALLHTREALDLDPGSARWGTRFFLTETPRELVGLGGFKGPPTRGAVELGYAVSPTREGRGIATLAVAELINDAFAEPEVTTIVADTLPDGRSSQRVLEKNGFARDGNGPLHEEIATWRFRLDRPGRRAS